VIALLNAIVGPLLRTLVDDRFGTRTQLLTHVGQSRQSSRPRAVRLTWSWLEVMN